MMKHSHADVTMAITAVAVSDTFGLPALEPLVTEVSYGQTTTVTRLNASGSVEGK